jgi:lipoyl(octanoyl) transferase
MSAPRSPAPIDCLTSGAVPRRPLSVWLAGTIGWDDYEALAERLAGQMSDGDGTAAQGREPTLLIYELQPCITIGRLGSRADVALGDDDLRARRLTLRFTGRGGGAVLHGPGQVCVALFAALEDLGLGRDDVGGYVARLRSGLAAALASLRCGPQLDPSGHDVRGRTGLLAAVGVAVRRGVACHGAFVNVCPDPDLQQRIITSRPAGAPALTMGSVQADVQRRVRLPDARAALVRHVGAAFAFPRTHVQSGFPRVLSAAGRGLREVSSRAG